MKITKIQQVHLKGHCQKVELEGLRKGDGIVTLTEEAVVNYCLNEGQGGLCTQRFKADLVVDKLDQLRTDQLLSIGQAQFKVTNRRKRCHSGCVLEPSCCQLIGHVFFLEVVAEGRVCIGNEVTS